MSKVDLTVITDKEWTALKLFKDRIPDITVNLSDYKSHNLWLLKWLRARDLDVTKAEAMIRKSYDWRAKEDIERIFEWNVPELIYEEFPIWASGFDKDGCGIGVIPFGKWDVRKVVGLGGKSDYIRYIDLVFERVVTFLEEKSTKDNMITQFTMIFDFEGFSLGQLACREAIDASIEIMRHFEANHPECLKSGWVINAPKIFEILFAFIKPIMTSRTTSKVRVYGRNPDQWRPALLENIEPHQLPSNYGGSNTSCRSYRMKYGYDIFPVYPVFPEDTFIPVTVEAKGKLVVSEYLKIDEKISWNFRTADYDIGFFFLFSSSKTSIIGIVGKESPKDAEIIFECPRADSHLHLQKGAFVAEKPGTYSLVFDNSFSRFRPKSLFYSVHVTNTKPSSHG